jgi:N-acyl-phosphatidylethanolamine-hydrolysing phospholipase D
MLKLLSISSGVPPERPIPDLPSERPNFPLLFGKSATSPKDKTSASPDITDKMTLTWVSDKLQNRSR